MQNRRIHAVVFDLWKTLIPLPEPIKTYAFLETSRVLGIAPDVFSKNWEETRNRRETGDLLEYLHWLNEQMGAKWSKDKIMEAIRVRKQVHGLSFQTPDVDAFTVLSTLRSQGVKTAVVSNCSSDVKELLADSKLAPLLHQVVLSAEIGIMKPDVKIFSYAANRLGVENAHCLYIGDGHDKELEGAARAGMHPILLDRNDGNQWDGDRITSLLSVLEIVDGVRTSN